LRRLGSGISDLISARSMSPTGRSYCNDRMTILALNALILPMVADSSPWRWLSSPMGATERCSGAVQTPPAPRDLVLLAYACFVGKPDLYCGRIDALLARDFLQERWEFFYIPRSLPRLAHGDAAARRACGSPCHEVPGSGSAWRSEHRTPRRSTDRDRYNPPTYDTMYGGDRPALDDRGKRCTV